MSRPHQSPSATTTSRSQRRKRSYALEVSAADSAEDKAPAPTLLSSQPGTVQMLRVERANPAPIPAAPTTIHIAILPAQLMAAMAALIIAITIGLYGGSLKHGIALDDHIYVMGNPYLQEGAASWRWLDIISLAREGKALGIDPDITLNLITRPVAYATFMLNRLYDGHAPEGYRAVNIIIHAANGVLVMLLGWLLLRRWHDDSLTWQVIAGPAAAGLLFVAHPLATESVTYITQRFESLATLGVLLAVVLHLLAYMPGRREGARRWLRVGSFVAVLAAMLSKETGAVAPLLILLADALGGGTGWRVALRRAWPALLCLPLIPMLLAADSYGREGGQLDLWKVWNITNIGAVFFSPLDYARTEVCVWASYLRLWVWPSGLNFDPDYPLAQSWMEGRVLVGLGLVAVLLGGAWLLRQHCRWLGGLLLFGLLWQYLALAPSSSIVPLPDVYAEHRFYLPATGLFIALGALLGWAFQHSGHWRWGYSATVLPVLAVCIALGAATLQRNQVYVSEETLYRDVLAKSPNRWRAWNGLGTALYQRQEIREALDCFRKAIALEANATVAHENCTATLIHLSRYDEALQHCLRALPVHYRSSTLNHNTGLALCATRRVSEAIDYYYQALRLQPGRHETRIALARAEAYLGRNVSAAQHYELLASQTSLEPLDQKVLSDLKRILGSDG